MFRRTGKVRSSIFSSPTMTRTNHSTHSFSSFVSNIRRSKDHKVRAQISTPYNTRSSAPILSGSARLPKLITSQPRPNKATELISSGKSDESFACIDAALCSVQAIPARPLRRLDTWLGTQGGTFRRTSRQRPKTEETITLCLESVIATLEGSVLRRAETVRSQRGRLIRTPGSPKVPASLRSPTTPRDLFKPLPRIPWRENPDDGEWGRTAICTSCGERRSAEAGGSKCELCGVKLRQDNVTMASSCSDLEQYCYICQLQLALDDGLGLCIYCSPLYGDRFGNSKQPFSVHVPLYSEEEDAEEKYEESGGGEDSPSEYGDDDQASFNDTNEDRFTISDYQRCSFVARYQSIARRSPWDDC